MTRVLFVCLGNICRSPIAEAVFRGVVARAGMQGSVRVDSAGTGDWQVGSPPDRRAIEAARRRGYEFAPRCARQVELADFGRFDWILAMDRRNLEVLESQRPRGYRGHLGLFLDLVPELGVRDVPDPYDGAPEDFERVLDLAERGAEALLATLQAER
jgi:protein-tyrosine phosphatase